MVSLYEWIGTYYYRVVLVYYEECSLVHLKTSVEKDGLDSLVVTNAGFEWFSQCERTGEAAIVSLTDMLDTRLSAS